VRQLSMALITFTWSGTHVTTFGVTLPVPVAAEDVRNLQSWLVARRPCIFLIQTEREPLQVLPARSELIGPIQLQVSHVLAQPGEGDSIA
jgi:hypothetical protein